MLYNFANLDGFCDNEGFEECIFDIRESGAGTCVDRTYIAFGFSLIITYNNLGINTRYNIILSNLNAFDPNTGLCIP